MNARTQDPDSTRPPTTERTADPELRPMTGRHVILGKGPVGTALADLLGSLGAEVRVLSRSGAPAGASPGPVAHVAVDAADVRAMTDATRGAAVIYNCANPSAYHRWAEEWPPMAEALLRAAEANDAVLATTANLYVYGRTTDPIAEGHPLAADGSKGSIRIDMWNEALERHRQGRVRVTEVRAADFYGPEVLEGGHLGSRVVPRLLEGRSVRLLGDLDVAHSFTYVPDVATALVRTGSDERAWGAAWHVPTAPAVTQRQAVEGLRVAAGVEQVRVGRLPWTLVRLAGLGVPMLRELQETRHQLDGPFVLDSSAFTSTFGDHATPLEHGFASTVQWWRTRSAA